MISHTATCTILWYHTLLPAQFYGITHFYLHYIMVSHSATCTILWYQTLLTELYYGITHCYLHYQGFCLRGGDGEGHRTSHGITHSYLDYIIVSTTATCTIVQYHTLLPALYYGIPHCHLHYIMVSHTATCIIL